MDTLKLIKYPINIGLESKPTTSSKSLLSKIKTAFGSATSIKDGLSKRPTEFYEFFINDKPLSEILTTFCHLNNSILDNWIGVLSSFSNKQYELNTINRLLLQQITEQELLDVFPKDLEKCYLDSAIESYKEELSDEEINIYCCSECGDYGCGGFKIKVEKEENNFVWTFHDEGNILKFHFDKEQYFNTFDTYRQTIIKKNN